MVSTAGGASARWFVVALALIAIPLGWTDHILQLYTALHTRWGVLLLTPAMYGLVLGFCLFVWCAHQASRVGMR